jgi:periplasmic mercuric ion binding protein
MKTKIITTITAFVLFIAFNSCNNGAATIEANDVVANATASFTVEGMTCEMGCAKAIEKKVAELPGVKKCSINFEKKLAEVEIDDTQFSEKSLLATIGDINDGQYVISNFVINKK